MHDEAPPTRNAAVTEILAASGVRARHVDLAPGDRWWQGDSGALLAFRTADGAPVALLSAPAGRPEGRRRGLATIALVMVFPSATPSPSLSVRASQASPTPSPSVSR